MRVPRVRCTIRDIMVGICGCGILLSLSPYIYLSLSPRMYWFHLIAGSLLGFALHRKIFGSGIIGGTVGGWASAALVAALAYFGPIDHGNTVQWRMKHESVVMEFTILSVQGCITGISISICIDIIIMLMNERRMTTRRLMLAAAIIGTHLAAWDLWLRHRDYRQKADFSTRMYYRSTDVVYGDQKVIEHVAYDGDSTDPEWHRKCAAYYARMKDRFSYAAGHPWVNVRFDPPPR